MTDRRSPKGLLTETQAGSAPASLQQLVNETISSLRDWAAGLIESSGKSPKDYRTLAQGKDIDRVCAAAQVLSQLEKIRNQLNRTDRSRPLFGFAYEALLLASLVHRATIVDNETGIHSYRVKVRGITERREERTRKAESDRMRYQAEAERLWAERPGRSVAQMAELVAKRLGGKPDTIRKKISRQK
jgi:hypothetical protein